VEPVADHGERWWVVVPNETGLSTAAVYGAYDEMGLGHELAEPTGLLVALEAGDAEALSAELTNDLTTPALALRPDLGHVPDLLRGAGARVALLSGSGPTWLGLATDADHAREIAEGLLDVVPRVFLAPGPVAGAHVVEYS
jgi:4-diphosphocytidyl-2-C-methyl-D-erythritol kinase